MGTRKIGRIRILFLLPASVYMLLVYVLPVFYNLMISFQNYTLTTMVQGNAEFIGFNNYIHVFDHPVMLQAVRNTFVFTLCSIVFQFGIGLSLALYFNRKFPLSRFTRTFLLLPWLLPLIVASTSFRWMFSQTNGVINDVLLSLHWIQEPVGWLVTPGYALFAIIVTNIWAGIPFNLVLLYSGLQDIPKDYYEAGVIDGTTGWKAFWHITLPSLRPVIGIVLMLGFIYTMQVFDIVLAMTGGGPANTSQILSTFSYSLSFTESSFGQGAAVGNLMMLVMLLFSLIYLRYGTGERD
jgi:multiple sugar transport system permease protein